MPFDMPLLAVAIVVAVVAVVVVVVRCLVLPAVVGRA
jgi:hypothetical protein